MNSVPSRERILITPVVLYQESAQLAQKIVASDWQPDVIIPILRGGASIATIIAETLQTYNQKPTILWGVFTRKYDEHGKKLARIEVYGLQNILSKLKKGQKVLFVDDVFDEGTSVEILFAEFDRLYSHLGTEKRIAVLHTKPDNHVTKLRPDYMVRSFAGDSWIVYPHEITSMTPAEKAIVYGDCLK